MLDYVQFHEAVGQHLQAPGRRLVRRRLAHEGRQVGFDAAVDFLVRAGLANLRREQGQARFAELAPDALHGFGAGAQHGGQRGGRPPSGVLVAIEQNLNLAQFG